MALLASTPRRGPFVFTLGGTRPIAGYSGHKARLDGKLGFGHAWTLHGLRKTARTLLSRAGIGNDVAELCLDARRPRSSAPMTGTNIEPRSARPSACPPRWRELPSRSSVTLVRAA